MSGKMTDEALNAFYEAMERTRHDVACDSRIAAMECNCGAASAHATGVAIRAHIAALTAERDEALADAKRADTAAVRNVEELDALRERVRALEAEKEQWRTSRFKAAQERHEAESRLAAIRQRAGEQGVLEQEMWGAAYSTSLTETLAGKVPRMVEAVARYIVGDDATAPGVDELHVEIATQDRAEAEGEGTPLSADDEALIEAGKRKLCSSPSATEPTTAEAFATVRADMKAAHRSLSTISLLERRMGAQERAVSLLLRLYDQGLAGSQANAGWEELRTALTDAPPVFTLEEVQGVVDGVFNDTTNGREVNPQHDVKWFYRQVSMRLAALRKA